MRSQLESTLTDAKKYISQHSPELILETIFLQRINAMKHLNPSPPSKFPQKDEQLYALRQLYMFAVEVVEALGSVHQEIPLPPAFVQYCQRQMDKFSMQFDPTESISPKHREELSLPETITSEEIITTENHSESVEFELKELQYHRIRADMKEFLQDPSDEKLNRLTLMLRVSSMIERNSQMMFLHFTHI